MKTLIIQIIKWLAIAYFAAAALIFAPYYNWKYSKDNSFTEWLFLGEIIPTLKAIAWPVYLFDEAKSKDSTHAEKAMQTLGPAFIIMTDKGLLNLTQDEKKTCIQAMKNSIAEAEQVSVEHLEKIKKGLSEQYKENLIAGMREMVEGLEANDKKKMASGCTKMNTYMTWEKDALQ